MALIVGVVGVANIMIISVLLAVIGGVVGGLDAAAATAVYASSKSWAVVIPAERGRAASPQPS